MSLFRILGAFHCDLAREAMATSEVQACNRLSDESNRSLGYMSLFPYCPSTSSTSIYTYLSLHSIITNV